MSERDESKQRKILVLGTSLPTKQVKSFNWAYIPSTLNVADFDTVVLDFSAFQVEAVTQAIDINRVPSFRQFARLLFSEGSEIVVIGRPFFRIGKKAFLESSWFLPLAPKFLDEAGETLTLVDPKYADYFDHVKSWSFCLDGWSQSNGAFTSAFMAEAGVRSPAQLRPRVYSIADNRYSRPIAFTFHYILETDDGDRLGESGFVTWLPPTTDIPVSEAIPILLRSRYAILERQEPPSWLAHFTLPAELPIRKRIDEIDRQVGTLAQELQALRTDLIRVERIKGILFETGEEVLEPLVLDALRDLGASIELPRSRGKEDARLTDPSGRLATIEIKGRVGPLRLGDVRQAHQWVADRIAYENCHSKGIIIANLNRDASPKDRAHVFPANCLEAAGNLGISLVTTSQVFAALVRHQEKSLDPIDIWDAIFNVNGEAALPTL